MTQQSDEERVKAAEAQNKAAQEAAQKQVEEDLEKQRQARIAAASGETTTTAPTDFETAAKATEELAQPPNPFNAKELQQPTGKGQPPAKNVTETTMPEANKAENVDTSEAAAPSPTTQRRSRTSST